MKKIGLLFLVALTLSACLNSDDNIPNFTFEYLSIDEYEVPSSFTLGEIDTVKVKYTLPNSCYSFERPYYETKDTTRIIAIIALARLEEACAQVAVQEDYEFVIRASQEKDYVLKFFKGKDNNGENIFEEVVVPVN